MTNEEQQKNNHDYYKNGNQRKVERFMEQIPSQAEKIKYIPQVPDLETRILRARLMLEEVMETIEKGLGLNILMRSGMANTGKFLVEFCDIEFEHARTPNIVEVADGLADQEVVNLGTAAVCGIATQTVFAEVMENNMLKLKKGTIDEFGKLVKPPDHKPPDVEKVLREQGWQKE